MISVRRPFLTFVPQVAAMHRALRINELLTTIFQFIINTREGPDQYFAPYAGARRDLTSFARVCRAFREPALDILWRSIWSISPLLDLIPCDESGLVVPEFGDDESPVWRRYRSYAVRVMEIYFEDIPESFTPAFISSIAKLRPSGLAPRLMSLFIFVSSTPSLQFASLFISPTLTAIEVTLDDPFHTADKEVASLYNTISTICPRLLSLQLHCQSAWLSRNKRMVGIKMVHSLRHLTSISFEVTTVFGKNTYAILGRLPALEKLTIHFTYEIPHHTPVKCLPGAFSTLRSLSVHLIPENVTWFFAHFPPVPVDFISVHLFGPDTNQGYATLFKGLALITDRSCLQKLLVDVAFDEDDKLFWEQSSEFVDSQFVLDITGIEPALQFRQLTWFDVQFGVPLYLTDADLLRIAKAWPEATRIQLSQVVHSVVKGRTPQGTLASIAHFIRYCPRLEDLGLFVDLNAELSAHEMGRLVPIGQLLTPYKTLDFGPSALGGTHVEHVRIAELLAKICLRICSLHGSRHRGLDLPDTNWFWLQVLIAYKYHMASQGLFSHCMLTFQIKFEVKQCLGWYDLDENDPMRVFIERLGYRGFNFDKPHILETHL